MYKFKQYGVKVYQTDKRLFLLDQPKWLCNIYSQFSISRRRDKSQSKFSDPRKFTLRYRRMDDLQFMSFSTVFQSHQDNGWVIMNGCEQWNSPYG